MPDVWLNPLEFFGVNDFLMSAGQVPTADAVLEAACSPGMDSSPEAFAERCSELGDASRIFVAPASDHLLTRMLWPLRHAKAAYGFGNYLGTISLCGMVAEMITIGYFDGTDFQIDGRRLDKAAQTQLWGGSFESLGQDKRIRVLAVFGLLGDPEVADLDNIRNVRKKYLHLASHTHDNVVKDARTVFESACRQTRRFMIKDIVDGKVVFTDWVARVVARAP